VGAPLIDSAGNFVGLMSAITRRRLEDAALAVEVIRIFSALAARELERVKHLESVERQNAELRRVLETRVGEARVVEEGAAAKSHLERDNAYLRDEIRSEHPAGIGASQEFRTLMSHVRRVAGTSAIVLIQGEAGSGKEVTARAIHNLSSRRNRPLVKLDCAAIPAEALEVELFGGLRSPQSEAAPRIGRLDFADAGTLLIDEVAALPLDLQAKLLRVIQQREFRPLGFQRTIKTDVRLLVTTNRDLEQAVQEGRFRSDLHQRLLVDPLRVPPLRRRRQDIPLLAERFLGMLKSRLGSENLSVSERMMGHMMTYSWPGNIRELKDLLFRAALSNQAGLDLPVQADSAWPEPITLEEADRQHVNRTLAACNWVIEGPHGAAALLDVPPSTLRSLMKRLNIQRAGKTDTIF
jgi:transcriptional regulator with GAF, ATPase, and Fis domain